MIASVVVTIDNHAVNHAESWQATIQEISGIKCVTVGDVSHGVRRLPVMIDSPDPNSLEEITRRLQECRGVAFVDVVFVHFENESLNAAAANFGKPSQL